MVKFVPIAAYFPGRYSFESELGSDNQGQIRLGPSKRTLSVIRAVSFVPRQGRELKLGFIFSDERETPTLYRRAKAEMRQSDTPTIFAIYFVLLYRKWGNI